MTTYGDVLKQLLPPGPAWSVKQGSLAHTDPGWTALLENTLGNVLESFAESFEVVDGRCDDLLE